MKAYDRGYEAFTLGILDNPYPAHIQLHKEWQRGFTRAYYDNLDNITSKRA